MRKQWHGVMHDMTAAMRRHPSRVLLRSIRPYACREICICAYTACIAGCVVQEVFRSSDGRGMTYDEYGEPLACAICRDQGVWARHNLIKNIETIPGAPEPALIAGGCTLSHFPPPWRTAHFPWAGTRRSSSITMRRQHPAA